MGREIRIYMDHMLLTYLYRLPTLPNCHLMRFAGVCSEFGAKIFYIQGKWNAVANALSRNPWDEPPFQPRLEFNLEGFDADEIAPAVNFMMNDHFMINFMINFSMLLETKLSACNKGTGLVHIAAAPSMATAALRMPCAFCARTVFGLAMAMVRKRAYAYAE